VFFSSHELAKWKPFATAWPSLIRGNSRRPAASAISWRNTRPIWKKPFWTLSAIKHNPRHEHDLGIGWRRHQRAVSPQGLLRPVCPHGAHHHRRRRWSIFFTTQKSCAYVKDICHAAHLGFGAAHRHHHDGAADSRRTREPHHFFPCWPSRSHARNSSSASFSVAGWRAALRCSFFYVFFAIITGSREQNWPWLTYLQAIWLQWAMLAVVIAPVAVRARSLPPRRRPPPQFVSSPSPAFCWSEAI